MRRSWLRLGLGGRWYGNYVSYPFCLRGDGGVKVKSWEVGKRM